MPHEQTDPHEDEPDRGTKGKTSPVNEGRDVPGSPRRERDEAP